MNGSMCLEKCENHPDRRCFKLFGHIGKHECIDCKLKINEHGLVEIDTLFAKELGFTSDKFASQSWLWLKDGYIYISMIESKNPGHGDFSELVNKILEKGYGVKVPTPFSMMQAILSRKGFKKAMEQDQDLGAVEVWIKEAKKK